MQLLTHPQPYPALPLTPSTWPPVAPHAGVMEPTATPHSAAAALLDFLAELPLLLPADKKAVLKLLQGLDPSGFDLIARSGHGISVFRTAACSSSNTDIYRVTGMGEVEAAGRVSLAARSKRWLWPRRTTVATSSACSRQVPLCLWALP